MKRRHGRSGGSSRLHIPSGSRLIGIATVILVAMLWCWYLLFRLVGDGLAGLGWLNAAGFQWGLLAISCTVVAAVRRAWLTAAAGALVAALIFSHIYWPIPHRETSAAQMRIVSASFRTQNKRMDEAARHLDALSPDLLVAQEVNDADRFLAGFLSKRPGWHVARQGRELIVSRWPLSNLRLEGGVFRATVAAPGAPLTVWNVHAPKDYQRYVANRSYFLTLARDVIKTETPGVVAGDFNASPWNEGYASIDALMDDGFRRTRWTPGFTFPGPARRSGLLGPMTAIDHVFATRDLRPLSAFVASAIPGSDHLPVVVDYALPLTPRADR